MALGPDAQADINQIPFGVISGSYRVLTDMKDRTDADATSKLVSQSPIRQLELTLVAQRQKDVSYHVSPLDFTAADDAGLTVNLWLYGRGDASGLIAVPVLKCKTFSGDLRVQGSQPQTVTIEGVSHGDFIMPGE